MSAINQAKSQINYFVKKSAECSIYEQSDNTKVCFGENMVLVLNLAKNRLTYKEFTFENGKAKVVVQNVVRLTGAEMFTVKHHFKKSHQMKDVKSA